MECPGTKFHPAVSTTPNNEFSGTLEEVVHHLIVKSHRTFLVKCELITVTEKSTLNFFVLSLGHFVKPGKLIDTINGIVDTFAESQDGPFTVRLGSSWIILILH